MTITFKNGTVLTPTGLKKSDLTINEEGLITDTTNKGETIDIKNKIILPAFFNGHTHLNESFCPYPKESDYLFGWLDKVHTIISKMNKKFYYMSCQVAFLEMVTNGFSGFVAHELDLTYKFWKQVMKIAKCFSLKGIISVSVTQPLKEINDSYLILGKNSTKLPHEKMIKFFKSNNRKNDSIKLWLGVEDTGSLNFPDFWKRISYSTKHNLGYHMHAFESFERKLFSDLRHGGNTFQVLEKVGALNENTNLAHCVYATDKDLDIISRNNASIAISPESNLNLVKRLPPVKLILKKRIPITIGTDGGAGTYDMFKQLRIIKNNLRISPLEILNSKKPQFIKDLNVCEISQGKRGDVLVVSKKSFLQNEPKLDYFFIDGKMVIENGKFEAIKCSNILDKYKKYAKILERKSGLDLLDTVEKKIDKLARLC